MSEPIPPRKQSRLSRLLKAKKAADAHDSNDSAHTSNVHKDIAPIDNHGQIPGARPEQNLILDKSNGEIVDEDSGEVVTTTTTTTTTVTTTKVNKSGSIANVQVSTSSPQPGVSRTSNTQASISTRPFPTSHSSNQTETSSAGPSCSVTDNNRTSGSSTYLAPPGPPPAELSSESGHHSSTSRPSTTTPASELEPDPVSPIAPTSPNFSYPNLGYHPPSDHNPNSQNHPSSVTNSLANLRAAAKGLHGVGETLRGTLNDAVDRNVVRSDPAKNAQAREKNATTIDRGRREIAALQEASHLKQSSRGTEQPTEPSEHSKLKTIFRKPLPS